MNEQSNNAPYNPLLINFLNHPLASPIRQLLTRTGRQELNQILIDDEENILQALQAGVEIESVYYAGDEVVSETLRKTLQRVPRFMRSQSAPRKNYLRTTRSRASLQLLKHPGPLGWRL